MKENAGNEIAKLKAQPGKDLCIGGPTIAASAKQLGLIDEYQLFVNPVVLGGGTPFFAAMQNPINLSLVETRTFRSGVVYLRYQTESKELK